MGMAASQARLLSITARMSNNEFEQQSVAYSKQRLSENSGRIKGRKKKDARGIGRLWHL